MFDTLTKADALSPAPLLDAVEQYRGTIFDLDSVRAVSADEFASLREDLAGQLRREGLASGDRVVLALGNGPLFIAALWAILECEGSPLLLHFKTPPSELAAYARRFAARFLLCEPPEQAALAEITATAVEFSPAGLGPICWGTFDESRIAGAGPVLRGVPLHPTSGSVGMPKVALRPGFAAMEEARHYAATMDVGPRDTIMAIPPMSHAYGYGVCAMLPMLTGANLVTTRRFSAKGVHRAVLDHGVTILPAVPAMLDALAGTCGADLRRTRFVLTAGAPLSSRNAENFHAKTGVVCCPLYGTTESGGISVATAADGRDVNGRVGPPMEGVGIETRAVEKAGNGEAGIEKLFVRSSSMMAGYLDEQGQISDPLLQGWFGTGDLARIAEDGAIELRGREGEVINVAGLKVVPCEVEESLLQLPGVLEVKVYGGIDHWGSTVVKAVVACQPELTPRDIRAHCQRHLVYYKCPQVLNLVEALPRTPNGKIDRQQLP